MGTSGATARSTATRAARALSLALFIAGCGADAPSAPPARSLVEDYLDTMLDIMQANSINRLTIDWPSFRAQVLAKAEGAETVTQAAPAIREALRLLGDNHSFFVPAFGETIWFSTLTCRSIGAGIPDLPADIGYVRVPGTGTTNPNAFAINLQSAIRGRDSDDLVGWIVDMRGNTGGNMWPMIAGLGSILGEATLGSFIDPTGTTVTWEYRDNASRLGGQVMQSVPPLRLRKEHPRVAVLYDNQVGSSGEATVIAFRGRPDTRSFGVPTCGVSTANQNYRMVDGAQLYLTVATMADRTGQRYGGQVVPDEVIENADAQVARAIEWLRSDAP